MCCRNISAHSLWFAAEARGNYHSGERKSSELNQVVHFSYIATTMPLKCSFPCMLSRGFVECYGKDLKPAVLRKNIFSVFHQHWFKPTLNTETCSTFLQPLIAVTLQTIAPRVTIASVHLCNSL